MKQSMTRYDIARMPDAVTGQDVTQTDSSRSVSDWVNGVCQLESVLTRHSAQQSGHILKLKLPHNQCRRVWLPASDTISLPAPSSVMYVETEAMQKPAQDNSRLSANLHSLRLLQSWQPIDSNYSLAYLQSLFDATPVPAALLRLLALISRLQDSRLKQLLTDLFGQMEIAQPFITLPASFNHHHSHPGGLLIHSVECAEWLESIACVSLPKPEAELTLVTALLHDLGKIETMSRSPGSQLVSHEVMSLTLVEPFLRQMQSNWKQGANALRQMLSWSLDNTKFPQLPGLLLVKMADQYSTALSARNMAFAGQPDYFYWASLKTPTSIQFFNRVR